MRTRKDIESLLRNISMSTGLSEEQLQDSVNYLVGPSIVEEVLLNKIKFIGDKDFTVLGSPQEFINDCQAKG